MSNQFYAKGLEGFADGSIDWDTHDIRCVLVDADYTVDLAAHDNLDDVPAGARATGGTSGAFTGKTVSGGVLDADDITFAAVTNATQVVGIVIYKHTGTESTSRLIMYMDTASGLPFTPNGGAVTITWEATGNKIGKL